MINIQLIDTTLVLCAKSAKDIEEIVMPRESVLTYARDFKIGRNLRPYFSFKIKDVEVVKVSDFVPSAEHVHALSMNSSAESAPWFWFVSADAGRDLSPGFSLEVELEQVIHVGFSREAGKDVHAVLVNYSCMTGSLSGRNSLGFDLSPSLGIKVEFMEIIVPGLAESIPASKYDHLVLPYYGSQCRSSAEGSSRGLQEDRGLVHGIIDIDIIGVIVSIVSTNEP